MLVKVIAEFVILSLFLLRIRRTGLLAWFIPAEVLYIPYFIFFGLKGTFSKYRWRQ